MKFTEREEEFERGEKGKDHECDKKTVYGDRDSSDDKETEKLKKREVFGGVSVYIHIQTYEPVYVSVMVC